MMILSRLILWLALGFAGCTRISINPQCPEEIEVDQDGALLAGERNQGGIPRFQWEARPASLVTIDDPQEADTSFTALAEGTVTFTLTAADGLFQAVDPCTTRIVAAMPPLDLAVTLAANPTQIVLGGEDPSTLLTCTRTGETPLAMFVFEEVGGASAELTDVLPGVSVAVMPSIAAEYTFQCVGVASNGNESAPATVTVTVVTDTRPPSR